jgi:hypothetical protein
MFLCRMRGTSDPHTAQWHPAPPHRSPERHVAAYLFSSHRYSVYQPYSSNPSTDRLGIAYRGAEPRGPGRTGGGDGIGSASSGNGRRVA